MMLRLTSVLMLLALAACASPTTTQPGYTDAEWSQEQRAQDEAAKKTPIAFNAKKVYGYKQIAALDARLQPIAKRIDMAAVGLCADMKIAGNCDYPITIDPQLHDLNAHADGSNVVVYPAMVDFVKNDNQLAAVIAHECAHNMMGHIAANQKNSTFGKWMGAAVDVAAGASGLNSGGVFSNLGEYEMNGIYSPKFEAEADYIGLYIAARAGFKIEEAPDLWRMMSRYDPDTIAMAHDHPNNPARTLAMTKTVAEIRAKQRAHQPLIPNSRNDA